MVSHGVRRRRPWVFGSVVVAACGGALKHQFDLHRSRTVDVEAVRRIVGTEASAGVANTIAERAFVLARDSAGLVPLVRENRRPRVLSVTYTRRADLGAGTAFNAELRGGVSSLRTAFVNADETEPSYATLLEDARNADVVVVGSYMNITSETATANAPRAFVAFIASRGCASDPRDAANHGAPADCDSSRVADRCGRVAWRVVTRDSWRGCRDAMNVSVATP